LQDFKLANRKYAPKTFQQIEKMAEAESMRVKDRNKVVDVEGEDQDGDQANQAAGGESMILAVTTPKKSGSAPRLGFGSIRGRPKALNFVVTDGEKMTRGKEGESVCVNFIMWGGSQQIQLAGVFSLVCRSLRSSVFCFSVAVASHCCFMLATSQPRTY
jgi:hypothetical protein